MNDQFFKVFFSAPHCRGIATGFKVSSALFAVLLRVLKRTWDAAALMSLETPCNPDGKAAFSFTI